MMNKDQKQNKRVGFTLVEVLVSLGVFTIVFSIATSLFTASTDLERQGNAHRVVQQNAAFFMEFLGKEVRNGSIDFATYEGEAVNLNTMPITELKLLYRGSITQKEKIYLQGGKIFISREDPAQPGTFNTSALTDDNVIIDNLDFYISPAKACTEASTSCSQPRVTAVLKLHSDTVQIRGATGSNATIQNTFSTRIYDY